MLTCGLGSTKDDEDEYDHYEEVKEKFPKELERMFIMTPSTNVKVKTSSEQRPKPSSNKIIDESMITQMSGGGDIGKLKNNLGKAPINGYDSR